VNTQKPPTHDHHSCDDDCTCRECASGKRNRFFKGKRMRAEEFRIEQAYGVARRRLINRSVLGWGVVRGFSLEQDPNTLVPFMVGSGFALDRHGRELLVVEPAAIDEKNTFIAAPGQTGCDVSALTTIEQTDADKAHDYLLQAHYAERSYGDAPQVDNCGCDPPQKNFTCETVLFSLTPLAHGKCPCAEADCHRTCRCHYRHTESGHGAGGHDEKPQPPQQAYDQQKPPIARPPDRQEPVRPPEKTCGEKGRGPHDCLCQWVTDAGEPKHPGTLCWWNGYCVDPADGVPLGCVKAWKKPKKDANGCDVVVIELTDGCSPRRIVKNNDLLYDLIRGCDLTRISWTSWHRWHRSTVTMQWDAFSGMFFTEPLQPPRPNEPDEVATGFIVRFSRPVRLDTIRRDTVAMTAITIDQNSRWRVTHRVPIVRLDTTPSTQPGPGPGLTDQVRFVVRYQWVYEELAKPAASLFSDRDFVIEIEIRGDLITDCYGQSVDANAIGLDPFPSGNGTPGGTYLSSFPVQKKPDSGADRGTW
jgi:hypothetical protein